MTNKKTVNINNVNKTTKSVASTVNTKATEKPIHTENKKGVLSRLIDFKEKINNTEENVEVEAKLEEAPAEGLSLEDIIARQLADYKHAPVSYEDLTKPVTYVTASNGIFRVVKTDIALFTTLHKEFEETISGLPIMEENVELLIPKIPFRHIVKALTFFRDVYTKDRTESSLLFFWNTHNIPIPNFPGVLTEGQLVTYCPVQENEYSLTNFESDKNVDWFRSNLSILLELHSHCNFSAFFSGVDDANENMNQFYGVWGHVDQDDPSFTFRWVSGNTKEVCSPDILIEWPSIIYKEVTNTKVTASATLDDSEGLIDITNGVLEEYEVVQPEKVNVIEELVKGPFVRVDYPNSWLTVQHSKKVYHYPGKYYGTNYNKKTTDYSSKTYSATNYLKQQNLDRELDYNDQNTYYGYNDYMYSDGYYFEDDFDDYYDDYSYKAEQISSKVKKNYKRKKK